MAFEVNESIRNTIEQILGRSIEAKGGDLAGYDEIVDTDRSDLRRLWSSGGVIAIAYLLHRLGGRGGLRNAKMYFHHVIGVEDMTASQWLEQYSSTLEEYEAASKRAIGQGQAFDAARKSHP